MSLDRLSKERLKKVEKIISEQPLVTLEQARAQAKRVKEFSNVKNMKFAIVCSNGNLKWISALSDAKEKIQKYASKISAEIETEIVKVSRDEYPIYVIEKELGVFTFNLDMTDITKEIKAIKKIKNFDDCYFTYYIFKKEYFAKPVGADRMGALEHVHVTNDQLKTILKPEEKYCPRCEVLLRGKNLIRLNEFDENNYIKQCINCGTSWNGKTGIEIDFEIVDMNSFNKKRKNSLSQKKKN